ncbi:hypothetical protein ABIB57_003239 [Devosia sp. UYZn731]
MVICSSETCLAACDGVSGRSNVASIISGDERRAGPGIARPHSPPTKLPTAVRREPAAIVEISGGRIRRESQVGIRGIRGSNSGARDAHTALGLPAGLTRGALSGRTEFGGVARGPRVKPAGRAVAGLDRGQPYGVEWSWFRLAPLVGRVPPTLASRSGIALMAFLSQIAPLERFALRDAAKPLKGEGTMERMDWPRDGVTAPCAAALLPQPPRSAAPTPAPPAAASTAPVQTWCSLGAHAG